MADGGPIRAFEISWNVWDVRFCEWGSVWFTLKCVYVWSKLDVLVLGGNVCGVYWLVLE